MRKIFGRRSRWKDVGLVRAGRRMVIVEVTEESVLALAAVGGRMGNTIVIHCMEQVEIVDGL